MDISILFDWIVLDTCIESLKNYATEISQYFMQHKMYYKIIYIYLIKLLGLQNIK